MTTIKKRGHNNKLNQVFSNAERSRLLMLRPLAAALSRMLTPFSTVGGAVLLSSTMANATVVGPGGTYWLPNAGLDGAPIEMAGGSLATVIDAVLTPQQKLIFVADTTSNIRALGFTTLTLSGGIDLRGAAEFGQVGWDGVVELAAGPVSADRQGVLAVAGGTLRNAAGQNLLSGITQQAATTRVDLDSTLDYNGGSAQIRDLQGEGVVHLGFGSAQSLVIESGDFSGSILGGAGIKKISTGTLQLRNNVGFAGAVDIASGTLQLTGTSTAGQYSGPVLNNGQLVFKQFTGSVAGNISGPGTILLTDQSAVAFAGTNTYSGTTTIQPFSQLILTGPATSTPFSGALGTGDVFNQGLLSNQRAGQVLIGNYIHGIGEVNHSSSGWLTLTADNAYLSGTTVTHGGTLEVGNGGTSGSVGAGPVSMTAGSTLIFNRSDDFAVANELMYSQATVIKKGAGTLSVTSTAAGGYDGNLDIQEGAVKYVNNDAVRMIAPGSVHVAAGTQLIFDNSQQLLLGEKLTGAGGLKKSGTARFNYSGDGAGFTGAILVEGGEFYLSNGVLGGALTVESGARLQGTGRIGSTDVLAGGMLVSSGYSRLRVNGNLSLKDGSTFRYYLGDAGADGANAGTTGTTRVTGDLDLSAKLQVRDNAQPTIGYYRLFTYGGALSGSGLTLDTIPAGHTREQFSVDTSRNGAVDLRVAPVGQPDALLVWNGGSGTWGPGGMQWQSDGQSGWSGAWGQQHAVFNSTAGTVSVAGTQVFKGLQFVSDGWLINPHSGGGALQTAADGSELRVLTGAAATIGTQIQGAGGIDKTGGGTLVLDGVNGYVGGTRLSAGVLSVSADSNLGDAAGSVMFDGGTLRVTGQGFSQTSRNLQWGAHGGAFDIASALHRFTVNQSLAGAGDLVKLGAGTLVLSGVNAYGNTRVEAGTLVGNTDSIRGNVLNQATLVFDQALDGAFAGDVSGTGAAIKSGAGTLTLTGRSAQDWHVAEGALATSASTLSGNVSLASAGALHLNASQPSTYAGVLSGAGALAKTGAGMLALTGDSSAFTGATTVEEGVLSVGIGGQGSLGGTVSVARDATLQGTGTVGSAVIRAGGAIAPGNSIGTLHVAGDLTLEAGSVYRVEADSQSNNSDRIVVSGTANLAGSVVHVGPDGNLAGERTYTILSANRVNGTFDAASSSYAFLDANLGYDNQTVTLRLDRKPVPADPSTSATPATPAAPQTRPMRFADAAGTANQRAVANALDSLSGANALYQYVLTLPEGAPAGVFDGLSGQAHASVVSSLNNLNGLSRNLPFKSLRNNLDAGWEPGAATAQVGGVAPVSALPASAAQPAWAELVGNWQTLNGNGNAARVDQRTGGVFVGADHAVGGGWRLGGALGFTDSRIRVDANSSKADVDSYSATIYGGKGLAAGPGKLNLLVGAGYTWHNVSTTRHVAVAGQQNKLSADYGASTGQLFTELGYALPLAERAQVEPFAGVAWSDTRTRRFQESGGLAALSGQSSRNSVTTTTLGLRGKTAVSVGKAEGVLRAAAGWRHAFGDVDARSTLAFAGSQTFTVSGAPLARNAAFTELGVDVAVSRSATIGLTYSGQYGGGNRENAGTLGVTWRY